MSNQSVITGKSKFRRATVSGKALAAGCVPFSSQQAASWPVTYSSKPDNPDHVEKPLTPSPSPFIVRGCAKERGTIVGANDQGRGEPGCCFGLDGFARRAHRRGIVLVIVLVVIVLATLAGYAFLITMQTENKAAHGSARLATLEAINMSGQEAVAAWMETPHAQRAVDPTGLAAFVAGSPTPVLASDGTTVGHFTLYSPADSATMVPFESESSKLHLVTLVVQEKQQPGYGRQALMRIPGMTVEVADAILDWIDEDDLTREFGAEGVEYAQMGITIRPRNAVPDNLNELLFVRGVTRELLYGERDDDRGTDWNSLVATSGVGVNSEFEPAYDAQPALGTEPYRTPQADGMMSLAMNQPWCRFLTVCSAERNKSFNGSERINLNGKDLSVLYLQLVQRLPIEWADFIIFYRQYGPADRNLSAANTTALVVDTAIKPRYNISSVWELLDARCSVPLNASQKDSKRIVLASPARLSSVASMEQIESLLDELTLTKEKRILGRIDLMTASRPVLLAIPGVDEVLADNIIAGRDTQQGRMWLISNEILNLSQLISMDRFLAKRGDVLRFRVKSQLPMGNMSRYFEVVWDASGDMAYQLEQRELPVEWESAVEFSPTDSTTDSPTTEPATGARPNAESGMINTSSTRQRVGPSFAQVSRECSRKRDWLRHAKPGYWPTVFDVGACPFSRRSTCFSPGPRRNGTRRNGTGTAGKADCRDNPENTAEPVPFSAGLYSGYGASS